MKKLTIFYFFTFLLKLKSEFYDCDRLNNSIISGEIILGDTKKIQPDYDYLTFFFYFISLQINNFNSFAEINISCSQYFNSNMIEITPKKKLILDSSFNLKGLYLYTVPKTIYFSNLKGIDVNLNLMNSFEFPFDSSNLTLHVRLAYSRLDFYLRNSKLLDNEADCNSYRLSEPNFLTNLTALEFNQVIFSTKLCPMLFMSSKLKLLYLNFISNSYIEKNRISFMSIFENNSKLINSDIDSLQLDLHYEYLNSEILNEHLFKHTENLLISGSNFYGVHQELFKEFFYLKILEWYINNIRQFFHTTQNKWANSIKFVDRAGFHRKNVVFIVFSEFYSDLNFNEMYDYPEEDFCLFIDLQNQKFMYSVIDPGKKINCSCTVVWILKYTQNYFKNIKKTHDYTPFQDIFVQIMVPLMYCLFEENYNSLLKLCDFESKLKLCNKTLQVNTEEKNDRIFNLNTEFDLFNLLHFIQYIITVYLNQIFAFIGIVTNIIVIVVVANIKKLKKGKPNEANSKKDNMFKHILIHSVFNVIYCFIMSFKLINLCFSFTPSIFCSSVATELPAQSFKIIFIEYFGNIAKTCCNVSYTAISISRIFLTGSKKSKGCLSKFNNLNLKIYLIVMVVVSSLLSIFNFFIFNLNRLTLVDSGNYFKLFEIDFMRYNNGFEIKKSFPMSDNNNFFCNNYTFDVITCQFWDILRIINNFLNDIFFFVITIIFDLAVLKNIANMINSKKIMVENFKEAEEQKKRKRILKMIIINGIIFTLSHLPEFLISILLFVIQNKLIFCTYFECSIFNEFGQIFIYFSIMSQLSINKNFNSLFKESFDNIIFKLKKKNISKREN